MYSSTYYYSFPESITFGSFPKDNETPQVNINKNAWRWSWKEEHKNINSSGGRKKVEL